MAYTRRPAGVRSKLACLGWLLLMVGLLASGLGAGLTPTPVAAAASAPGRGASGTVTAWGWNNAGQRRCTV